MDKYIPVLTITSLTAFAMAFRVIIKTKIKQLLGQKKTAVSQLFAGLTAAGFSHKASEVVNGRPLKNTVAFFTGRADNWCLHPLLLH